MTLDQLKDKLPEYAKDIKLNLSSSLEQIELTPKQLWGTALGTAIASKNKSLIDAIAEEAKKHLSDLEMNAAKGAAALMSMNNIYYRFVHLSNDEEFSKIPARLRMNILKNHGVDNKDFELWSLAVSAINGCGMCIESHWKHLKEQGVSREVIVSCMRIAATVYAAATVLNTES